MAGLDAADGIAGDHQVGSNDWVVGPSKTTTKTALLANDPHLGIGMPSVWYINGLRCRVISKTCPWDVAGVTFPGVPGVVLGHNASIAWGATNVDPDVQDLFAIQPDPKDADAYLVGDESVPYAGPARDDQGRRRRAGRDGRPDHPRRADPQRRRHPPEGRPAARPPLDGARTTSTGPSTRSSTSTRRRPSTQFHAAFRTYGAPSQNFVYADVKGHIGYVLPGRIPIRADASDRGDRIRSGSDGKHDWTGTIPFEDLPWQLDPPSGMIVTANNAAVDDQYPYFIAQEWDPGYRAKRITDLLEAAAASGGVSTGILRSIQMDPTVTRAERVIPHRRRRPGRAHPTATARSSRTGSSNWAKHDCTTDSLGCAAYEAFEYRLVRDLVDDELGPLAREYVGSSASLAGDDRAPRPAGLPVVGRRPDDRIARRRATTSSAAALDEAGAELRAAYGDPANWTWGRLHQATFEEATLGLVRDRAARVVLQQGPVRGAGRRRRGQQRLLPAVAWPTRIRTTRPTCRPASTTSSTSTNLPSYRLSIDMADLDGARIIQTTGQSGNPFDRHYGDLINALAGGRHRPAAVLADGRPRVELQTLALVPKQ